MCLHSCGQSLAIRGVMASSVTDAGLVSIILLAVAFGVLVLAGLFALFSGSHRKLGGDKQPVGRSLLQLLRFRMQLEHAIRAALACSVHIEPP